MKTRPVYKSTAGRQEILALYDEVLARWPLAYTHINVPTRYGNTFVIASGRGASAPALVLLHGSASNSATSATIAAGFI